MNAARRKAFKCWTATEVVNVIAAIAAAAGLIIGAWNAHTIKSVEHQTNSMHNDIVKMEKAKSGAAGFERGVQE